MRTQTLPRSSIEIARLEDQASALVAMMHDQVIHAPLRNPHRLIDVGCGTGTVSCYLGANYPDAQVYGIDLSPVPARPKPSNVHFIEEEIRALLSQNERLSLSSADFVFSRLLVLGMSDWPGYVRAMASLLRSGGWVEMQEFALDLFLHGQYCSGEWGWLQALHKTGEKREWDFRAGKHVQNYMKQAGLMDVQTIEYRIPMSTWAVGSRPETRRIGEHAVREYGRLYYHAIPKLLNGMGYSAAEIEGFQNECVKDLAEQEGKEAGYWVTIGRKP